MPFYGKRPKITDEQRQMAAKMLLEFASYKEVARETALSLREIIIIKREIGMLGEPVRRVKTSAASCHAQSPAEAGAAPLPSPS